MVRSCAAFALVSLVAGGFPPPFETAKLARYMVNKLDWGVLTTTSSRSEASTVGDPFGNPYSHADVGGVPYFYASDLDASMVDIFSGKHPRASFSLTEAEFTGKDEAKPCQVGTVYDPEFPLCARLVVSGTVEKLDENSTEGKSAKAALISRHSSFSQFPPGHGFYVAKMNVDELWLLDFVGGAKAVDPNDYFAADVSLDSHPLVKSKVAGKPPANDTIGTARWMAATLDYGVLSSISTRTTGSKVGDAFGNPYSFADVGGNVYFWATAIDASGVDFFGAKKPNPRATMALSEASLTGTANEQSDCVVTGSGFGDPENPPCARLVLSGEMSVINSTTSEGKAAKAALFKRHPSFAKEPAGHDFQVWKLNLDGIWLIDFYGGAAIIPPEKYLAGSEAVVV